jgi:hypothetical protein
MCFVRETTFIDISKLYEDETQNEHKTQKTYNWLGNFQISETKPLEKWLKLFQSIIDAVIFARKWQIGWSMDARKIH